MAFQGQPCDKLCVGRAYHMHSRKRLLYVTRHTIPTQQRAAIQCGVMGRVMERLSTWEGSALQINQQRGIGQ